MGDRSDPADHLVWERVAVYRPADPGRDVRTFLRGGCRQDACVPVRRPRDSGLRDLHRVVGGGARWVAENLHATLSSAASHRKKGWTHGRTRTAGLLLTKNALFANRQPLRGWWRARQARRPDRATVRSPSNCVGASIIRGSRLVGAIPVEPQLRFSVGGILVWLAISCLRSASICSTVGT